MRTNDKKLSTKRFIVFIRYCTIGLTTLIISCSDDSGSSENLPNKIIPAVEALQSRQGNLPLTQRLSGIVEAKNQIEIYPEISAVIVEVYVRNADVVKKGDPLLRLRDKEFVERGKQAAAGYQIAIAQLRQAEARLNEMKSEIKRTETLAAQGLVSSTELETAQSRFISVEADVALAEARVEQSKATVEERNEALSQTLIRAPISGTVGNRNAEVGMLVTGSTRLFTLGQLDNVRIKVVLTDRMLNYIRAGQRAEILNENAPEGVLDTKLSRISPFLNPVSHSTEAEIDLENPEGQLKPGMFVTVDIFYGESEQATLVPLSALYENPASGVTGVYITETSFDQESVVNTPTDQSVALSDPADFKFVPVDVLAKGRMEAGIRGIDAGKWVITLGQNLLGGEEGMARVRPVQWAWVERMQKLQREDLMEELVKKHRETAGDALPTHLNNR
jgi:RND family efflux transporter MFP subunit